MKSKLQQLTGLEILENESLGQHTTFQIGGSARYFVRVNNKVDLLKVLNAVRILKLKYFIFGGGSNVLVSDNGFDGIAIKMEIGPMDIKDNRVSVFVGNNLGNTIREVIEKGLGGLEFSANIPGTIGGAVRGNAGAYGQGVGDFVQSVEMFEIGEDEVRLKILNHEECNFDYRHSIFKEKENWIIAQVNFVLPKVENKADCLAKINDEFKKRSSSQPYKYPSAGCSFKNILMTDDLAKYQDWSVKGKLPAAKLIDQADLKGTQIGGAKVSEEHANFIINFNNATASDVIQLISLIKTKVRTEFGVQLEEEIQYIGF